VVTREGLPLGYEVFAGNTNDTKTLREIVRRNGREVRTCPTHLGLRSGRGERRESPVPPRARRPNVVGTPRSMLRKFEQQLLATDWDEVVSGVEVKLCPSPDGAETFILAKSRDRAAKEEAMHRRFVERIEAGLTAIAAAAASGRLKDPEKAGRRIGRLLGQNSRGSGCFQVQSKSYSRRKAARGCKSSGANRPPGNSGRG